MARLITEKLTNLEKELEDLKIRLEQEQLRTQPITVNNEFEKRLTDCESKINELIEQITPILLSHADALKEIMNKLKA